MKKIVLSTFAALGIATAPVNADDVGLYLGVGYAYSTAEFGISNDYLDFLNFDVATDSLLLLAGVDLNEYIGVEGRYYWNVTEYVAEDYNSFGLLDGYEAQSFALYAKPQYNFGLVSLYGLIGVAMNEYTALLQSGEDTLFSWGGGAKFHITESFSAFIDYTDLGETDTFLTTGLSSWNFGIAFKF